jgi:ABC-type amino acid transport substrate-binding protein
MKPRKRAVALIAAVAGTVVLLPTLAIGTASAGTAISRGHVRTPQAGNGLAYAAHTQVLTANGTVSSEVACPAGTLPVGGGTGVQDPRIEHVGEAGFVASAATGKVDGYVASVRVSGLARGARVRFAVQVACVPSATTFVVYSVHTQVLLVNGTVSSEVACPAGTLPVGGGTGVQDLRIEHVGEAGFVASPATGKVDGYVASVRVSGLARGARVRFAVQVACVPSAASFIIYPVHTQVVTANGTSLSGVVCPAGTLPVGGGTAVQNPRIEDVGQAGFVASAATGKVDGYVASVLVSGLARGARVRFAVQVACILAATSPPTSGGLV